MKKLETKHVLALVMAVALVATGCGDVGREGNERYTYDEAVKELDGLMTEIDPITLESTPYLRDDLSQPKAALSSIDTFPIMVQGDGQIDIEVAAATELSSDAPDDLINVLAHKFNQSGITVNGKTASVSVRRITSGEVLTYAVEADYKPDVYIPSAFCWGDMMDASGISIIKLTDRLFGNTAGVLMKKDAYDSFVEKHGDVTLDKIIDATLEGEITYVPTNPYSSTTGLNNLGESLKCFDPADPFSDTAKQKLIQYQQHVPFIAQTTAVLKREATEGGVDVMAMEAQAYANDADLRNYVFTPFGIRHDHPVYTFDYVSDEKQQVAQAFIDFCLSDESQALATKKGFNQHEDYFDPNAGMDGAAYLAAQAVWKQHKDGDRPVIAVFVADVSGSMDDYHALADLKESLESAVDFINSDYYIGLVSYSHQVYVNLDPLTYKDDDRSKEAVDISQFDKTQRAKYLNAVSSLTAGGGTATYDAVLVALDMLRKGKELLPDATLKLIVLSDGDQRDGYSLNKITNVVGGMRVPIYTIGYNLNKPLAGTTAKDELERLSTINEATLIDADSDDIMNRIRDLFVIQL